MNWREYERHLLQELKDAQHNMEYHKEKYQEALRYYHNIVRQKKGFDQEIEKLMGGK
jgi:hypothetical protein